MSERHVRPVAWPKDQGPLNGTAAVERDADGAVVTVLRIPFAGADRAAAHRLAQQFLGPGARIGTNAAAEVLARSGNRFVAEYAAWQRTDLLEEEVRMLRECQASGGKAKEPVERLAAVRALLEGSDATAPADPLPAAREATRNTYRVPVPLSALREASTRSLGHVLYEEEGVAYDEREAWDFTAPEGTPVMAAADGTVADVVANAEAEWHGLDVPPPEVMPPDGMDGNRVVLRHANGEHSRYCHLKAGSVRVRPGDRVRKGDVIAALGNTGWSEGPHLHFTVHRDHADGKPGWTSLVVRWDEPGGAVEHKGRTHPGSVACPECGAGPGQPCLTVKARGGKSAKVTWTEDRWRSEVAAAERVTITLQRGNEEHVRDVVLVPLKVKGAAHVKPNVASDATHTQTSLRRGARIAWAHAKNATVQSI